MAVSVSKTKGKRTTSQRRTRAASRTQSVERYTAARKAEFLLNNAATQAEYKVARQEVKALGIDPDSIPHQPPVSR